MKTSINPITKRPAACAGTLLLLFGMAAQATVNGKNVDGYSASGGSASMTLLVKADHATTGDGSSVLVWGMQVTAKTGFTNSINSLFQRPTYPGPTLIVTQGTTVAITLKKDTSIPIPVSLVFPGQQVVATGGSPGLLTNEAVLPLTDSVTYTFTASQPGTYWYHGGTRPELAVEMGIFGALIVRPSGALPPKPTGGAYTGIAYRSSTNDTAFDREYLLLLSEMDPRIHVMLEFQGLAALDQTDYLINYKPNYFFVNGRTAPDTLSAPNVLWLPVQPYNALAQMHPGERILMREIEAGRESHPFHNHGQHSRVVGKDGRMLSSNGSYADLAYDVFTTMAIPGQTYDEVFTWTGQFLNWDIYGPTLAHTCNGHNWAQGPTVASNAWTVAPSDFDASTGEYCPDHGKAIPVALPGSQELIFGDSWSGSPYLGQKGTLIRPGDGSNNVSGGYFYMWHSHTERELTNDNIFPGGMLDMLIVEAPWVPIP